jgi:type IV pilus assembly protein PilQ
LTGELVKKQLNIHLLAGSAVFLFAISACSSTQQGQQNMSVDQVENEAEISQSDLEQEYGEYNQSYDQQGGYNQAAGYEEEANGEYEASLEEGYDGLTTEYANEGAANSAAEGGSNSYDDLFNSSESDIPPYDQGVAEQNPVQETYNSAPYQSAEPPVEIMPESVPALEADAGSAPIETAPGEAPAAPAEIVEIAPVYSLVRWIGYHFDWDNKQVSVEIMTEGKADYKIYQETNLAGQPELVVRYFNAALRQKIKNPLDTSEFKSPVAYVRLNEDEISHTVDVKLTFREEAKGLFSAQDGWVRLIYPIPAHYFEQEEKTLVAEATAIKLSDIDLLSFNGSIAETVPPPVPMAPTDGAAVPIENVIEANPAPVNALPATYEEGGNTAPSYNPANYYGSSLDAGEGATFSFFAVAQYDFGSEGEPIDLGEMGDYGAYEGDYEAGGYDYGYNDDAPANEAAAANAAPVNAVPTNAAPVNAATANSAAPVNAAAIQPVQDVQNYEEVQGTEAEIPEQDFKGKATSVEFHEAPLNLVLKTFEDESGNNFIYPKEIGDILITIRLKSVPWDEALKAILETYGLGMVSVGQNVARIDRLENLSNYLKQLGDTNKLKRTMDPTKILVMRLSNANAEAAVTYLEKLLATDIANDARTKMTSDARTNTVVAEATPVILQKIKSVVERIDLATPQVEIKSRIVEVSQDNKNFFGVLWRNTFNYDPARSLGFGTLQFPNSINSDFAVDPNVRGRVGTFDIKFGSLNRFIDLDLLLGLEKIKGTSEILQESRLMVRDRQKANIVAGDSQFFRVTQLQEGGGQTSSLEEVTYNLSLEVTPQITASDVVNMNIIIDSDLPTVIVNDEAVASKNNRHLETDMALNNGETAVIGGIYNTKRNKTQRGIPWLSDIPIIGALFRSTYNEEIKTELLILVTPTILNNNGKKLTDDGMSATMSASAGNYNNAGNYGDSENYNTANAQQADENADFVEYSENYGDAESANDEYNQAAQGGQAAVQGQNAGYNEQGNQSAEGQSYQGNYQGNYGNDQGNYQGNYEQGATQAQGQGQGYNATF